MTIKQLEEILGQKLDRREVCDEWRAGYVYRWLPGLNCVYQGNRITIRPGEDLSGWERNVEGIIALIDV